MDLTVVSFLCCVYAVCCAVLCCAVLCCAVLCCAAVLLAAGALTYHSDSLARCVVRLRYNISTADFNPASTTSRSNGPATSLTSPVTQNPVVDVGFDFHDIQADGTLNPLTGLRLAVDTDQFGRTFQDRSHVFYVMYVGCGVAWRCVVGAGG